jgi:ssDNA-binding Zn-finger/Zn-ribbon topoisomerase 1
MDQVFVVKCPKCGKGLVKPTKKLENSVFFIAIFTCENCETKIKIAY